MAEQGPYSVEQRYRNPFGRRSELPGYYGLRWTAGQRGKPGINGDMASATEAVRMVADPDFEVLGTNGTSALSTRYAEGGITFTTAGADNDQMILVPHLDTNQSAWTGVTWGTDQQTEWEAEITTGSSVAAVTIWLGLKLTNTSVVATDDDQVMFRYAAASDTNWQCISSVGGSDTTADSGVAVAASKKYHFAITFDEDRVARFYIDGDLVATSAAIDAADLIPYIGVHANTAAAKAIHIHGAAISRVIA